MNRREALKAVMAMSINGRTGMKAFAIEPPAKYIVFYATKIEPSNSSNKTTGSGVTG